MANLENKRIKDTYEGLIKTNDNNAISSEVELTDGAGNATGVSVSTDGRVVASGTVSFGSLKDTGENITITKFVDEADGISSNDNDTTIPTTAAVKDFVENTGLVTSVNTQTGAVVLNTDNIAEGSSNLYYTESRVSANSSVAANTAKNTYPSADATKVSHITVTQAVDLDVLESNVATNNAKVGITTSQANAITANTAKVGITTDQANAITANTAKNSYPSGDATKVGHLTVTQAVDLDTMESNIATNNAKVGITTQQASDIIANNAKVGITNQQASDITANNAKISFDSSSSTKLAGIEAGAEVNPTNTDGLSEGSSNLYFTDDRVAANSAVAANTAKTGITNSQANAIIANTAKNSYPSADATKVGHISVTQAVDLDTMESNIATNNAKISFDNASSTKLSNIEANADVTDATNVTSSLVAATSISDSDKTTIRNNIGATGGTGAVDSVNTQTGDVVLDTDDISEGSSNLYYTESRVSANTSVAANTLKNSYPSADSTKVGFISVTQAVDLDTMETNIATNNAKISFDNSSSTKLAGIEAGADVTDTANVTAAGALMDSEVDANIKTLSLPASTTISSFAKTILDDADASAVRTTIGAGTSNLALGTTATTALAGDTTTISSAESTKLSHISITQAVDLDTIETNVAANNAKVSFDSTSSTKLSNIEDNADVTDTANVTAAGALMDSEVDANIKTLSLPASTTISTFAKTFLDDADAAAVRTTIGAGTSSTVGTVTEVTVGTGLDVTNGTTTPSVTLDLTEITVGVGLDTTATGISLDLSEFTDMTADMVETDEFIVLDNGAERRKAVNEIKSTLFSNNDLYKVIGLATDHSSRVLSDSGTSEGATSIMQNFEILIAN